MTAIGLAPRRGGRPHALFVQGTDAAAYPPIIHAASLMAEAGWRVCVLSAPIAGIGLEFPRRPDIELRPTTPRPSHVMTKAAYAAYAAAAARLALSERPEVVYASDPLGAGPGLLAARLSGARLVYHEHDTPAPGALHPWLARLRRMAARRAAAVVFPNRARARIARTELGFSDDRLHVVWNMPRRCELPMPETGPDGPLRVHYHGSISPVRLPEAVVDSVRQFGGRVLLSIAGYEAPGAAGYVRRLLREFGADPEASVHYVGQIPLRSDLLLMAARAHVGLAVVPGDAGDLNLRHLTGASNKPFDYMAAGLALLVSDLPDWRRMFVGPGYGVACDPGDRASVAAALGWLLDRPEARREMARRGRARIAADWNYDTGFRSVIVSLRRAPQGPGESPGASEAAA